MFKAILDTNIIVDAFAKRKPYDVNAEKLLRNAALERFAGFVTGSAITDIYYIVRRQIGHDQGMAAIRALLKVFTVISVGEEICAAAVELGWNDFEDAVLAAGAIATKVDFVVTRDKKLYDVKRAELPFQFIQPHTVVALLESENT
jgi:predicted nucleic acid-binding protein